MRRNAQHLTPIEAGLHRRLFGAFARRGHPVSDAAMWRYLRKLRSDPDFDAFRMWLIGSRVEPGRTWSDIDLALSPRAGSRPSDLAIERALWRCRNDGLYAGRPACVVDPCYRPFGPVERLEPLPPDKRLIAVKLFSPRLLRETTAGRIREYRRLGYCSIEYARPAGEAGYYSKLPRVSFEGALLPCLRPAIEVLA
jgi:hypothetical protein